MKQFLLIAALIIGSFVVRAQSNLASSDSKSDVITIAECECNQYYDNAETNTGVRLGLIRDSWDEENRLMAISQDGYVSNYWYDGDGERVIKEHGGNHAVFVNSAQDSVLTDTRQFTIYPSAYFVVHNGNWFTKHIYIGSERIASRMGSMRGLLSQAFVNRPVAGSSDNIEDLLYDDQCDMMALVMKSNYEYFDQPYNGQNRHDLNGAMVGTQPMGGSSGARYYWMLAGTEDADSEGGEGGPSGAPRRGNKVDGEGNRYYCHSDHLGSSMLITNDSCNVTQQLDYLPYGVVFLEKRANVDYHTPYKFNGKELDEETGLYYYGARYMNPRLSIWYATDPMQEKFPDISSYGYCKNNPVIKVDPLGKECVNSIDENGNKILESNIVVLLEKKREITQDMSAKKRQKIEKENAKIEKRNTELMNHVQQSLSAEFANAKNSKGESVTFKINVIGFETDNPRTTNIEEIIKIARLYAIPAETPELSGRGLLWNDLACPAVLSQAHYNSPDSHGIALRDMLILLGDNKSSTLAYEFGHTLHAEHWTEGLMSSPPDVLSR